MLKPAPAAKQPGSWLGVYVSGRNAMISNVLPNTPAARAGLRASDLVLAVGGHSIQTSTELIAMISALKPGTAVELKVVRRSSRRTPLAIRVVVEAKPGPSEMLRRRFLGEPAQDFDLPQVDGGVVSLRDLRGEVVVVEVFASWCQVCKSTFQTLSELSDRGAVVLAISSEDRAKLERYVRKTPPPFPVLEDFMGRVQRRFDARQVPLVLVIDREGIIRHIGVGGSIEELDRAFEATKRALLATTRA